MKIFLQYRSEGQDEPESLSSGIWPVRKYKWTKYDTAL